VVELEVYQLRDGGSQEGSECQVYDSGHRLGLGVEGGGWQTTHASHSSRKADPDPENQSPESRFTRLLFGSLPNSAQLQASFQIQTVGISDV
jgi:hypothetical protein